jgi:NADPH-dependent curcumin reductase
MTLNQQWLLVSRPSGWPSADNFRLISTPIPTAAEGEVVVRNHFMSLDPYMRGRTTAKARRGHAGWNRR